MHLKDVVLRENGIFILFILFSLLMHNAVQAQYVQYTYHDDDKEQIKEIFHVKDTISNTLEGKYQSYYINGNLESLGSFANNETVGVWEFFYEDGKLKMRGDLEPGSSDGYWEYFFESGIKNMEGRIKDRKRVGEWSIYYESGELKEKGIFREGRREGLWEFYYEDGRKKGSIDYAGGKGLFTEFYPTGESKAEGPRVGSVNNGLWKYYYKDGSLQAEGNYNGDEKSGIWKYYHRNGQVSATGEFDNNKPSGEWQYYFENGKLSSTGNFSKGKKDGLWSLYYPDGTLKGESVFDKGSGTYKEFYETGELKIEGKIEDGLYTGLWKYYYEDGVLEGECEFEDGIGEYTGYFHDGTTVQTIGTIENGKKIGKWKLFGEDGELSGYYHPVYGKGTIKRDELREKERANYGIADYKFKGKKRSYFEPKRNEYRGFIVSLSPLSMFVNRLPCGMELYMEERMGFEFEFEGVRDPFFEDDNDVPLYDNYKRGYRLALKQKFYNPFNEYGMWYFGHVVRFSNLNHYANVISQPENVIRVHAKEHRVEYSLMLGYRLIQSTSEGGFTADAFISGGGGYRSYSEDDYAGRAFDSLDKGSVSFAYNFGLNIGYSFSVGHRRRR
ncbi:hypothetical protein LVD15_16350 [Fulvivirga maritima]|uniref:toxin-antitoxin system YwqK family antitoxin n=1 Tax=Fulvivirga maritima TaxID=2904247 RepID=UPI001F2CD542|nr:toxin-antitoxin system YwqK family antitoxin [Fulvivirga maritima]UII24870.1 hypothetical protein LVD15_16350 [Fulvivirga maritima]